MKIFAKYSIFKEIDSPLYKVYLTMNFIRKMLGLEGIFWIAALIYLALFINPVEAHYTFCPLSNLGFDYCPGCGLGNSIAFLFHGNIQHSVETHILGIPVIIFLILRIFSIIKFNFSIHNKLKTEERTQHA